MAKLKVSAEEDKKRVRGPIFRIRTSEYAMDYKIINFRNNLNIKRTKLFIETFDQHVKKYFDLRKRFFIILVTLHVDWLLVFFPFVYIRPPFGWTQCRHSKITNLYHLGRRIDKVGLHGLQK